MSSSKKRYKIAGVVSLCVVILSITLTIWLSRSSHVQHESLSFLTYGLFFFSACLIYTMSFFLWRNFYAMFGHQRSSKDAFVDMGLIAIGKYVPGKIWGLLLRGSFENNTIKLDKNRVAVSVLEQVFSLTIGAIFITLLVLTKDVQSGFFIIFLCFSVTAIVSVPVLPTASFLLRQIKLISVTLNVPSIKERLCMGLGYALLWALSTAPILVLMQSSMTLQLNEWISIASAFLASMIIGWLALFAPGGIGVRESMFLVLAPSFLSWQEALYWIALHRSLFTIFDLVYGSICIGLLTNRARQSLTS